MSQIIFSVFAIFLVYALVKAIASGNLRSCDKAETGYNKLSADASHDWMPDRNDPTNYFE